MEAKPEQKRAAIIGTVLVVAVCVALSIQTDASKDQAKRREQKAGADKFEAYWAKHPDRVQFFKGSIQQKQVMVGMTYEEVGMAWGSPERQNPSGHNDWLGYPGYLVMMVDGKVSKIEATK